MSQERQEVSRDLNPMNYSVWDSLIGKVYAGRIENFTGQELKDKEKKGGMKYLLLKFISPYLPGKRDLIVDSEDGGHIDYFLD